MNVGDMLEIIQECHGWFELGTTLAEGNNAFNLKPGNTGVFLKQERMYDYDFYYMLMSCGRLVWVSAMCMRLV